MAADRLGRGDHVVQSRTRLCVADVLEHRAAEEIIHLQHQTHLLVQRFATDEADVLLIDQDAPALRLIEPGDQRNDAALAAAGGADQCDHLAGFGAQAHVVKNRALRVVAERDIFESHVTINVAERFGLRHVLHFRLCIQQRKDAFAAGHRLHQLVVEISQRQDRVHKPIPIQVSSHHRADALLRAEHKREKIRERPAGDLRRSARVADGFSAGDQIAAIEQDGRLADEPDRLQKRLVHAVHPRDTNVVFGVVVLEAVEDLQIRVLPVESRDHAHAGDVFSKIRRDARPAFARDLVHSPGFLEKDPVGEKQDRPQPRHRQEHPRARVHEHRAGHEDDRPVGDDLPDAPHIHFAQAVDVAGEPADDSTELRPVVIAHRKRLQMREQLLPQ